MGTKKENALTILSKRLFKSKVLAPCLASLCLNTERIADIAGSFLERLDIDRNLGVFAEFVVLLRRILVHIVAAAIGILNRIRHDLGS